MTRRSQPKENKKGLSLRVDNHRGSTLWAFNHFRSPMLTSLLNDLVDLERTGLSQENCQLVTRALDYFTNSTTEVPSGGFLTGKLYPQVEKFSALYQEWNEIQGQSEVAVFERKQSLEKLRKQRQKITDTTRSLQFELSNNLDKKILADTYQAIGEMINLVPNVFNNLSKSFGDYIRRGGFTKA